MNVKLVLGLGAGAGLLGLLAWKGKPAVETVNDMALLLKLSGGRLKFDAFDAQTNTLFLVTGARLGARPYTLDLQDQDIWNAPLGVVQSTTSNRSGSLLENVIDQFGLPAVPGKYTGNRRYYPRVPKGGNKSSTFCNILVQDVTRALGLELPWGSANDLTFWLRNYASKYGWRQVDKAAAQVEANAGKPTIAAVDQPGGIGHVAMLRPGAAVTIAQAGSSNLNKGTIGEGFGNLAAAATFHTHA